MSINDPPKPPGRPHLVDADELDEEVPKLPRSRKIKLPLGQLMSVAMLLTALVTVLVMRKGCADSAGSFIQQFDPPADAAVRALPGEGKYIRLRPGELPPGWSLDGGPSPGTSGVEEGTPGTPGEGAPPGDGPPVTR